LLDIFLFDNGSRDGNGVPNENELLEGEAKMIEPGEAGIAGDEGVIGEARAESVELLLEVFGLSLGLE
jgi:hypothetical protein